MIHLVTADNRHLYTALLVEMFRQRHELFVEERGWSDLNRGDGLERDQYDDAHACYLLWLDHQGKIGLSSRLRPTEHGGVLVDHFPSGIHPAEHPVRGPDIWEFNRFAVAKNRRGPEYFHAKCSINLAMSELMLMRGARRVLGFSDVRLVSVYRAYSGLQTRPIGLPFDYGSGSALAFEIAVGPAALAAARSKLKINAPQLFEASALMPAGTDVVAMERALTVLTAGTDAQVASLVERIESQATEVRLLSDVPGLIAELKAAA